MKPLRHGPPGRERPGMLDADGRLRDLSGHVPGIAGLGEQRQQVVDARTENAGTEAAR